MKSLLLFLLLMLPTHLWAFDIHTFDTNFTNLQQIDGKLLGIHQDDSASLLTIRQGKLNTVPFTLPTQPPRPEDILADGLVVQGKSALLTAWLGGPSTRYDHGVLLDNIEATRLYASLGDSPATYIELDSNLVFEDRFPRIVDFDDDGEEEIVVIRTDINSGAGIAVYGLQDDKLILEAESDTIGLSHRWLNIVGVDDFNNDRKKEIAAVITPHIGGTLALFQQQGRRLIPLVKDYGYSNHKYGSRELGMSATLDLNNDGTVDLVVPDIHRRDIILLTALGNKIKLISKIINKVEILSGIYVSDLNKNSRLEFVFLLTDGTLKLVEF